MKKQAFSEIKVKDIILAEFNKALLADRSAVNGIDHVLSQDKLITVAENISRNSISFFLKNKTKFEILTSDIW